MNLATQTDESVFQFCRSPQSFLLNLAISQGRIAKFNMNGKVFAILSDPELVDAVLKGSMRDFEKGEFYDMIRPAFGESIFVSDREDWIGLRSIVGPLFSNRRINLLAGVISYFVDQVIRDWESLEGGDSIDILASTKRLAFDVVGRGLLGISNPALSNELFEVLSQIERIETVRLHFLAERIPAISGQFQSSGIIFERADRILYAIADECIRCPSSSDDMIGASMRTAAFLELAQENKRKFVRDLISSMLTAGYVSTGESMFWAIYLLAQHPEAQARAKAEIRESAGSISPAKDLKRVDWATSSLPYFSAVLNESLRLYPPIWIVGRVARKRIRLGDEEIVEGTRLICSPYVLHRMPALWSNPVQFKPERFLPGALIPAKSFIPFGAGVRGCLGRQLAMMQLSSLVTAMLKRFNIRVFEDTISLSGTFSLQPRERVVFQVFH